MPKRIQTFRPRPAQPRPTAAERGYCSAAWRRTRLAVIARDEGKCQLCGILVTGREAHVDHIIEKPRGTDAMHNLRLLCQPCHSKRHAQDSLGHGG
ncbi:MAG: HNH endonuclease [Caulobacteraceae bacterium]|nr:HNH endonuclease [Caulobacteraceae bacterium]